MKVYLRTFGCRANQYDGEAVRLMVEAAGGELVDSPELADRAVFNSCAVTGEAEAELRRTVRRTARRHPGLRSVIMGCAAALRSGKEGPDSLHELPGVEHVIGGADLDAVARALDLSPTRAQALAWAPGREAGRQRGTRALLRIQDGCDEHCTFCVTRLARGASRSRTPDDLIAEACALAEWHPEIVLTGIHIGGYGRDIGTSLGALVERLLTVVRRARFRLSSLEATEVDGRLAAMLRTDPARLVPHLHAPLQSGSDRVLKRMGRHWYSAASYADAVLRLTADRPVFALGADLIAGFPGETERDHEQTLALIARLPFTYLHVFPYSPRPDATAGRLTDEVPRPIAARRAAELREAAARATAGYVASRHGGLADVVVLGGGEEREGLTEDYLAVALADHTVPRGTRLRMRLEHRDGRLAARALWTHAEMADR